MLISLDWLSDFVDLPNGLDARDLAEQFTLTCAEVEEVTQVKKGDRTPAETVSTVDDWIIEIENKAITHRPDLWGHYGIAREVAAMLGVPLKPLEIVPGDELDDDSRPAIPIEIDDPKACPRYSGILIEGVRPEASPEWMQARLANVNIRPINALVDLSNYVMAELGQPTHAFDASRVDRIEVGIAKGGEKFTTLDEAVRTLPAGAVMIQSNRKNVAIGGIMGWLESEVTGMTKSLLLESANFDAATIRRAATALGLRSEASTRFEKSLDPAMTVLAIARFIYLARKQFPDLKLVSHLSDCFPDPPAPRIVSVDPGYVSALIGKSISLAQMKSILEALEFKLTDHENLIDVIVPSFRATKDIECEADIIEEVARFVGFGNIEERLPHATVRHFAPNGLHRLEKRSLQLLCLSEGYHEIHDYNWYAESWLKQLGYDPGPSITLKNPAAAGLERMRKSLAPGLLHAAELNRREMPALKLINIGSVFSQNGESTDVEKMQRKHLGLLSMARSKKAEDPLLDEMKGSLSKWAREMFDRELSFTSAGEAALPWQSAAKTAHLQIDGEDVGMITAVPLDLRRRIDEHFTAWSVVLAELNLTGLADWKPEARKLPPIPEFPIVELDYSVLANADQHYEQLHEKLVSFNHSLLQRLSFEGSYAGKNLPAGRRSLLLRARIGDAKRTLTDDDIKGFSREFEEFLTSSGLEIRR